MNSKTLIATSVVLASLAASFALAQRELTRPMLSLPKTSYALCKSGTDERLVPLAEAMGMEGMRFLDHVSLAPTYEVRANSEGEVRIDVRKNSSFGYVRQSDKGTELMIVKDGVAEIFVQTKDGNVDSYTRSYEQGWGFGLEMGRSFKSLLPGEKKRIVRKVEAVRAVLKNLPKDILSPSS